MASAISEGRGAFLERLLAGLAELREASERLGYSLRSVGVGIPGLIDRKGVIHASVNMQPLDGVNLKLAPLSDAFAEQWAAFGAPDFNTEGALA